MNQSFIINVIPIQILYEILFFLDWKEYCDVAKELNIPLQLNIYHKYNKSIDKIKLIDNVCYEKKEYLDVIKYLHSLGIECTQRSIVLATAKGHVDVIKYLCSLGIECTMWVMKIAIEEGHIEVVKYLHSIGVEFTEYAIYWSSRGGHLDIITYLYLNNVKFTEDTIDEASYYGHLDVVKFLKSIQ